MRIAVWLGVAATVAVLASEVFAQQTTSPKPASKASASARTTTTDERFRYIASVRDIMHVLVEANADRIFDAVAIDVTAAGIREKKPETDEEWSIPKDRSCRRPKSRPG